MLFPSGTHAGIISPPCFVLKLGKGKRPIQVSLLISQIVQSIPTNVITLTLAMAILGYKEQDESTLLFQRKSTKTLPT